MISWFQAFAVKCNLYRYIGAHAKNCGPQTCDKKGGKCRQVGLALFTALFCSQNTNS
jgi:hypothetical protein